MSEVDYPSYVDALLVLLDRIEAVTDDEIILRITRQRHQIARDHGFTVEFGEPGSNMSH